jgi:hypothetical protein
MFEAASGPLSGMKLIGFGAPRRRGEKTAR